MIKKFIYNLLNLLLVIVLANLASLLITGSADVDQKFALTFIAGGIVFPIYSAIYDKIKSMK